MAEHSPSIHERPRVPVSAAQKKEGKHSSYCGWGFAVPSIIPAFGCEVANSLATFIFASLKHGLPKLPFNSRSSLLSCPPPPRTGLTDGCHLSWVPTLLYLPKDWEEFTEKLSVMACFTATDPGPPNLCLWQSPRVHVTS